MSSCSIAFSKECPCGGRTSYEHNERTRIHEATKKHQKWVEQCPKSAHSITYGDTLLILDTTITPIQKTTPKSDGSSASSSPSTSSTAGKAC